MPFEDLATEASAALAAAQDHFRSALATTIESVRVLIDDTRAAADGQFGRFAAEFGALGPTYLDLDKLLTVISAGPAVSPSGFAVVERAHHVLEDLATRASYTAIVPPGGSLDDTVGAALADVGRAMGAARVVDLARRDAYHASEHERYLDAFPFSLWSTAERRLAPPLIVGVAGADLRPAALSEYLDGGVKLVLLVEGPATPAPLVRLITSGVFVGQASDLSVLARLAAWEGPGVVAVLPESSAAFIHDPSGGSEVGDRLTVSSEPSGRSLRRVGPFTVAQQRDEVRQLSELAARNAPVAVAAPTDTGQGADDPVGKLAAWLLAQADPAGNADKDTTGR